MEMSYKSHLVKFNEPQISEFNGDTYIWQEFKELPAFYDGFNNDLLIPELIKMAIKEDKGKVSKNKLIIEWVKNWGVLEIEEISENVYGQKISSFWDNIRNFTTLWIIYKCIANREYKTLEIALSPIKKLNELKYFSDDTLTNYQWNAMNIITTSIEMHINKAKLKATQMRKTTEMNEDHFKITPGLEFENLIDVMYFQLFIALTENKKVCPICDRPFTPMRKNSVYCSNTCKLTAKSRRYRNPNKNNQTV